MLNDGIHEGIISEEDWELAHQKRQKTGVSYEKTHSLEHEHILSGILKCPLYGSGMYGNVNRKREKTVRHIRTIFIMPASIEGWWMGIIAATANNGVKIR